MTKIGYMNSLSKKQQSMRFHDLLLKIAYGVKVGGLYENVLDEKSGYSELCVCDCILDNKEEDIKRYIGVIDEKE